ncbi:MAG: hypothetical protein JW940_24775 [Polyangiaceae bacterium]|nr:hypothetical protein [Polyangiaceae bacterium]
MEAAADTGQLALRAWDGDTGGAPSGRVWFDGLHLRRVWRFVFAEPRLAAGAVPRVSQASRDIYFGGKSVGGGSLSLIGADGGLDGPLGTLDWQGADVVVHVGCDELPREEYRPVFTGVVDRLSWTDAQITLDLLDSRERLNITLPTRTYSEDRFPRLGRGWAGKPRALLVGPATNVTPVPIDLTSSGYRVYEIADCTDAGLTSLDAVYSVKDDTHHLLTPGIHYTVDLASGRLTILADVQLIEMPTDKNRLDVFDTAARVV